MLKTLKILEWPNSKLAKASTELSEMTTRHLNLIKNMYHTMYKSKGIGLAANQVGSKAKILVMDVHGNPLAMINPKIVKTSAETYISYEGCLSFPNTLVKVERYKWVKVSYRDVHWNKCEEKLRKLEGRCFQHELDHLEGRTMMDCMIPGTEKSRE